MDTLVLYKNFNSWHIHLLFHQSLIRSYQPAHKRWQEQTTKNKTFSGQYCFYTPAQLPHCDEVYNNFPFTPFFTLVRGNVLYDFTVINLFLPEIEVRYKNDY